MLTYTFVECFIVQESEYACPKLSHAINFCAISLLETSAGMRMHCVV